MNETELKDIIAKHEAWHNGEAGGCRADLRFAKLRFAYLRGAHLRFADLSDAHLRGADLSGADLRFAKLRFAYLSGAHLRGADLSGADLRGAHLRGADLRGAHLRFADLSGADLSAADLSGARMSWTDHTLLSEILFRAAKISVPRRQLAGLVAISRDWCWEDFLKIRIDSKLRAWALNVLLKYRQPEDDIPDDLANAWDKMAKAKGNK